MRTSWGRGRFGPFPADFGADFEPRFGFLEAQNSRALAPTFEGVVEVLL